MSGGKIPREFIDDLLTRIDIVDLIDSFVPLKKVGQNYTARCPFHTEKSPSFSVNRNKQFYHCFGCGASGNAISFLIDFNHLNFVEAVEDLATFAGIEVPKTSLSSGLALESVKSNAIDLYILMEQVAAFYVQQLRSSQVGKVAADYLKNRGITGEIANTFMLGYAPEAWDNLGKRFDKNALIDAGLLVLRDDNSAYDRFRNRIMFPIRDKRGRIIGFGGRVLDNSVPKYLNSPETSLFHKGKEVYGLYELLKVTQKPQRILIVEGYMDVIALAQAGINYSVATLGTSTSQAHLDLLFRFSLELVFCFDGDNAGQGAAWRAVASALPALKDGRQIRIMILPQQHDPDSLIREAGKVSFEQRIEKAQVLSDYFFEHFAKELKLSEIEGRAKLKQEAETYLKQLPIGTFRELMLQKLSELTKVHIQDLQAMQAYKAHDKKLRQQKDARSLPSLVMILLIQNPKLLSIVEKKNLDWNYLEFDGIEKFKSILKTLLVHKPINCNVLLELYRGHNDEVLIKKLAAWQLENVDDVEKEFSGALDQLLKKSIDVGLQKLFVKERDFGLTKQEQQIMLNLLAQK